MKLVDYCVWAWKTTEVITKLYFLHIFMILMYFFLPSPYDTFVFYVVTINMLIFAVGCLGWLIRENYRKFEQEHSEGSTKTFQ